MSDSAPPPRDTFGSPRLIQVSDLIPSRRWELAGHFGGNAGPQFSRTIHGNALDAEAFAQFKQRTAHFHLTLKSDETRKEEWNLHVADRATQYVPSQRWAEEPPTVSAFQNGRELGGIWQGEWWMECAVPPLVLKQLEADLASGGVNEVQIRIDWAAPDDDTFYYGRVDSVRWSVQSKQLEAAETAGPDTRANARVRELVISQLSDLHTAVTFGFIALFALLIVGDLRVILSGWAYAILALPVGALAVYLYWQLVHRRRSAKGAGTAERG